MTRLLVMLVVAGCVLGFALVGYAQVVPETPLRVVALPPFQVLLERGEDDAHDIVLVQLGENVRSGVGSYLAGAPEMFDLTSDVELVESLSRNPLYSGTLSLARQ